MEGRVTTNFTWREVIRSMTATRLNIDNSIPTKEIRANVITLARMVLEPIRVHYDIPFSPSSWFRCYTLNKAIGGSDTSDHMTGCSVDIEIPGIDNLSLARWIARNLVFDQLILEHYDGVDPTSGWVHVSYRADGNRRQILTYSKGKYTTGLPPAWDDNGGNNHDRRDSRSDWSGYFNSIWRYIRDNWFPNRCTHEDQATRGGAQTASGTTEVKPRAWYINATSCS